MSIAKKLLEESKGVTIVNASAAEPMVMLKHFAYNPALQASGLLEEE